WLPLDLNGLHTILDTPSHTTVRFHFGRKFNVPPGTSIPLLGFITDGGTSLVAAPPRALAGVWNRIYSGPLDPRWFGAACDGVTDDSAALQAMIDTHPGGHYLLPGSVTNPVKIKLGKELYLRGCGYTFEGGGCESLSDEGGTVLLWDAGVTGIVTLGPG